MLLNKINLRNKLLYVTAFEKTFYMTSFTGQFYALPPPYTIPKCIISIHEPISCLIVNGEDVVLATWNGNIYKNTKKIANLGNFIVKAMALHDKQIFVAVDTRLYIIDAASYRIINSIDCMHKILCMKELSGQLFFGCGIPLLAKYDSGFVVLGSNGHDTSILAIGDLNRKMITGSADGTVRCNNQIIYKSEGWIRALEGEYIADDKKLVQNGKILSIHNDYISGIAKVGETVVCIGLDGFVSVICAATASQPEDDDIDEFMREF